MIAPAVGLNHAYRVVDAETYEALRASSFLGRTFAPSEARTTRADGGTTWTGLYLYGRRTYFEFFAAGASMWEAKGRSALAFGVDTPEALPPLADALRSAGFHAERTRRTRRLGGEDLPWFEMLTPGDMETTPELHAWLMAYAPDFLARWHPEAPPQSDLDVPSTARDAVLTRYAAVLPDAPADPMLGDVTGLHLDLSDQAADTLHRLVRAFGFAVTRHAGGFTATGARLTLHVRRVEIAPAGITRLDLSLQRAPDTETAHRFGPTCTLTLRPDGTATWTL